MLNKLTLIGYKLHFYRAFKASLGFLTVVSLKKGMKIEKNEFFHCIQEEMGFYEVYLKKQFFYAI